MVGQKTGGRRKGTPNRLTNTLKEMAEGALADAGGREYLVTQARENPGAFLAFLGKFVPKDLNVSGEIRHTLEQLVVASKPK